MKYIKYIALLLLLTIGFGLYIINQPKESLSGKNPDFVIQAGALLKEYETDEQAADKKFLDKIILVEGKINSINSDDTGIVTVFIDAGSPVSSISCQLSREESEKTSNFEKGTSVGIKGVCTGMLMDVVLVECVIKNSNHLIIN